MACDTDKRLRRVHVSRMLPGKGESGEGFFSFYVFYERDFITVWAQQDIKVEGCRWIYEALASC